MSSGLTKRQSDVLYFIKQYITENKIPPSIKDICMKFGFASTNAVYEILQTLEKKGHITRGPKGTSRGIVLLGEFKQKTTTQATPDPLYIKQLTIIGEGNASNPLSVFMQSRGQLAVDTRVFSITSKQQYFAAVVPDDAVSPEGIKQNDYTIVAQSNTAHHGDIVIALMNDQTIIRTFYKKGKETELVASSKGYPKIKLSTKDTSIVILGIVKGVIRVL